ncbi:MAG TPA: protein-export chaperone SecB [Burkholderiales bacterium]|jgi:preprotein translocase subunit SecB
MSQQPNTTQPTFTVEKLFVKDLSIEVPNAPRIYLERETPQVEIQMNNVANPIDDGFYEVLLTVTVTAKLGEKSVFLVEATQGGVFQIRNVPQQEMEVVLGVTCTNILYPYVREVVSDAVVRAGFPPVVLAPVNFEAIFQARQQSQGQASPAPTH